MGGTIPHGVSEPGSFRRTRAPRRHAPIGVKVPEVALIFWVVKLATTAGGESMADLLAMQVALAVQIAGSRYRPVAYWAVVVLVGIGGTLITDTIVQILGLNVLTATGFFLVALLVTLGVWYRSEGTLSIHSITTRRRELFYWAAVLETFALGTAAGDLTAFHWTWGFPTSMVFFAALITLAVLAWRLGAPAVACFWGAYIMTRPLGATTADWLAFDKSLGALGLGLGPVSVFFGVVIAVLVGWLAVTGRDTPAPTSAPEAPSDAAGG
jgi:uncharacterized membrane-anchored protein